jgi:DNA primase
MIHFKSNEILNILNDLNIKYVDKGKYVRFQCVNPLHDDNHPSMTMLKNNGFCRCWSCGVTYTFQAFIKQLTGKDSRDYIGNSSVLSRVFQQSLVMTEKKYFSKLERKLKILNGKLFNPIPNTKAYNYLKSINVTDEMIKQFGIKYADYAEITFADQGRGTKIQDRICIPIYENTNMVNLECRDYTEKQSLKVIYPKGSKADTLWNFSNVALDESLYVVEGIKSAFRIYQYISKNVVATLGSAIGNNQKSQLNKCSNIILFPDNDDAGESMIEQINDFIDHDFQIIFMPQRGQDPADGTLMELQWAIDHPTTNVKRFLSGYDFYKNKDRKVSWG